MSNTPIFIINLATDVDKRKHMEALCKANNIEGRFIDAVYGKKLSIEETQRVYDKQLAIKECGRELTLGEIGCTLSHLAIYQAMLDENIQQAVVLEDDVLLAPQFLELIGNVSSFPTDYELMLLGYYADEVTEKISPANIWSKEKIVNGINAQRLVMPTYGTHGYLINLAGAKKLLRELALIKKPIDHYTGIDRYLNMYALDNRVVLLDPTYKAMSCIEEERKSLTEDESNSIKKDAKNPFIKGVMRRLHLFDTVRFFYTLYKRFKILGSYK